MAEQLTAVPFNDLPSAHDGYTVLYDNDKVCKSDVKLSELVGDISSYLTKEQADSLYQEKGDYLSETDSANFYPMTGNPSGFLTAHQSLDGYATQEWVNNKLEEDYYDVEETNNLLDEKLYVSSFEDVSGTFLTAHQDISFLATKDELSAGIKDAKDYADEGIQEIANGLNDLTNYVESGFINIEESIDEKLDTTAFESVSGDFLTSADLSDYYKKTETSGKDEISTALEGKEDKIFVAEYDVTTYQELLDAYNAGKKIICNYYPAKESLPTYVIVLKFNEYSPIQGLFKFSVQTANNAFKYVQCTFNDGDTSNTTWHEETTSIDLSNYYTKTETSASSEISDALDLKEDKVFIAEYNVTPYADIKAAYDAGKQIVCKYNPVPQSPDQTIIAYLTQYVPMGNTFCFAANNTANQFQMIECSQSNGWVVGNHAYQEQLYITGEDNTITAINNSAIGGGGAEYSAGMDLTINNNIIAVNTYKCAVNSAQYAFVEGASNQATGPYSHAEGSGCMATDNVSHAEGNFTRADNYSHAEGKCTYANNTSHVEGLSARATGNYSHAEGSQTSALSTCTHTEGERTYANGYNGHAEGMACSALGSNNHAEGNQTKTSGQNSHAEGFQTFAGEYGHAEGYQTTAIGLYDGGWDQMAAHAEGYGSYASGAASHAEGYGTRATSGGAHAEGRQTSAWGRHSHAEGYVTKTMHQAAHAEGYGSSALGKYSHAEGASTLANSSGTHAEGEYTSAYGRGAHTEGAYTIAYTNYMHAQGKYNKTTADVAFVIGNGTKTDESARSDAFIVDWNGVASAVYMKTSAGNVVATNSTPTANQVLTYDGTDIIWADAQGGGSTDEYVPLSAERCTIGAGNEVNTSTSYFALAQGSANSAKEDAFAQGNSNYANSKSIAQGKNNSALYTSFAQGESNYANNYCFTQGYKNSASNYGLAQGTTANATLNSFAQGQIAFAYTASLAQGQYVTASNNSFAQGVMVSADSGSLAQGTKCTATNASMAQGQFNIANNCSQTLGHHLKANNYGLAIGGYNDITTAAFVIGNGTSEDERSDLFVIQWDGTVSGTGNIYASGGQVVTDVMLTSATNSTTSFVTNGVADLTPLYTYIKSLEDRIAALEAAQGGITVNGIQPTVNGNTITVGE